MYDESGKVRLHVIKGQVDTNATDAVFQIDGLSGATITSNGVTHLVQFWLGDNGYGPMLVRLKAAHQLTLLGDRGL